MSGDLKARGVMGDLKVLHHSHGRLRLRSPLFSKGEGRVSAVLESIFSHEGILNARVNPLVQTILVTYDPDRIKGQDIIRSIAEGRRNGTVLSSRLIDVKQSAAPVSYTQAGRLVTNFQVVSHTRGRLRLRHPALFERSALCVKLKQGLEEVGGFDEVRVNPRTASILVKYDPDILDKDGFIRTCDEVMAAIPAELDAKDELKASPFLISSISFALSFVTVPWIAPVSFTFIACTALPVLEKTLKNLWKRKLTVDVLDSAAIISALGMWHLPVAAFVVWLHDMVDVMTKATTRQSQSILGAVFSGMASSAWILKDGEEVKVSQRKIREGDIVVVSRGQSIPADGVVERGEGAVDEQIISGDSSPIEKTAGDDVYSSTVLLAGKLYIKARGDAGTPLEATIAGIIRETAKFEPRAYTRGMEFAGWMVIPTLALGGLGLTTMGLSSALAIFHANFGTGIRVAIPTVLLSYLAVAARNGIVVKEGKSLEKLLQVDTVIFEKADRLAAELPRVAEVVCREGLDEKEILAFAAAAHARFASPISRAIVERAREMKLPKVWLDDDDFRLGFGISAVMKGRKVKMGSMSFMERERVEIPTPIRKRVKHSIRHGGSAVLMSINGLFAGGIFLESGGLLEGRAVVEALKKRGKRVILLSEDSERATKILAERLGIDEYHAGKGPHERAALVKSLQSKGKKVAVAGNDPLSPADVLISLKGVSDIAENEADVVLLDGNPLKIEILFQVAEGLDRTIRKCFKIILVPNSLCMFGAVAGLVQHGLALALHSFANLAASINATMPLRYLHATPGGRVK